MKSSRPFLTAEWRKLAIANYKVDPAILKPYLPGNTELDLWEDTCYLSLVGFMFLNTKMLGIGFPFHRNFEEVNLRFYVKHHDGSQWKRGVVFIKEIVPKPILALVAKVMYHEPYESMKMSHHWSENGDQLQVRYSWRNSNHFEVTAKSSHEIIPEASETEFITEHYWGYTRVNDHKTFEYEVTHPRWTHYPVIGHNIQVDFGRTYGSSFAFLDNTPPTSVMLAEGSEITVENKRIIT
jgi:uncharacterized protein YqjF (DUF2071 family)